MDNQSELNIQKICNAYNLGYEDGFISSSYINPFKGNAYRFEAYALGYTEGLTNRVPNESLPSMLRKQAE